MFAVGIVDRRIMFAVLAEFPFFAKFHFPGIVLRVQRSVDHREIGCPLVDRNRICNRRSAKRGEEQGQSRDKRIGLPFPHAEETTVRGPLFARYSTL